MNKSTQISLLPVLMLLSMQVWAYGSSSSTKACEKPRFSAFQPTENAAVSVGAAFGFEASANTNPKKIEVTVKGEIVKLNVTPKNTGFLVQGKLPNAVKAMPARISIAAESLSGCKTTGGWLVDVGQ